MKIALIVLAVVILVVLVGFGQAVGARNSLVTERTAIDNQWAQVDVALQRRADLIPHLGETVKRLAQHEETVFKDIADARAALLRPGAAPAEKIAANGALDSALGRLLVITENYPNLKSNENFLRLQDELAGTENRIAIERRKYNEVVTKYNTDIQLFPKNLAAGMFGFTPREYFKADSAARTVPKVSFQNR